MRSLLIGSVGLWLLLSAESALAHHAFAAEYDFRKPISLPQATITRVEWINPHAWIHVEVKKPDGKIEEWMIEGNTPNALTRRGVTLSLLKPGVVVSVTGFQAKDGSLRASGRDLIYPGGRRLLLGASSVGVPEDPGAGAQK